MSNPAGEVEVRGTAAANGTVGAISAEAIVSEIERTRESLARTIDSITERVSPMNNVRRLRDRSLEQLSRPEVQLAAAAVGLAVVGFVVYRVWGARSG